MDAATLFAEHHAALFRYLTWMTGDPDLAADAAQETFVRLLERQPCPEKAKAWLFQVGTNVARESVRTHTRRIRLLEEKAETATLSDAGATPAEDFERQESRRRAEAALAGLSQRDRVILLMREEGFCHREIAEAVGTTTGSVGTMIARALNKLAYELQPDGEI